MIIPTPGDRCFQDCVAGGAEPDATAHCGEHVRMQWIKSELKSECHYYRMPSLGTTVKLKYTK